MPDPRTATQRALDEFYALERPGWSDADWVRVYGAAERVIAAYIRHALEIWGETAVRDSDADVD